MNLLDWSRIQSGKLVLSPEKIKPSEVLDECEILLQPLAEQKNIDLTIYNNTDALLFADKEMLKTILRNLATNAFKFSHAGGTVVIETEEQPESVIFSVSDNGVGISAKQKENIFSLASSISTEGTAQEKGTGLGLILCKEFIDMHGGKIWLESEINHGSVFKFTISKYKL
ncbi:MAG: hypothetical protein C0599_04115 [Salinivirgaceae bacterium]|nr:MAG: hypothetical protein C0599_04115 [Salinivirgaceae bacterium]